MITPIITPGIARLIEEPHELHELVSREGAIDLIDLDQYRKNLTVWNEALAEHRVETYLAHKATKSPAVLRATLEAGTGIDVSSLGELESALNAGFTAERIECTGPKNNAFLARAASLGCLISIDSIEELERLRALDTPIRILIRIANPTVPGRTVIGKRTKFGVRREQLSRAYELLRGTSVVLEGFHVHMDGMDPEMRAGITEGLIELIIEARENGHRATRINLGGGIKAPRMRGTDAWQRLMQEYEREVLSRNHTRTWDRKAYGMYIGTRGTIEGRAIAEMPALTSDPITYIQSYFGSRTSSEATIAQLIFETDITLMLEPGTSLLADTGASIVRVIGVKDEEIPLVVCDANMFTIGTRMLEPLADPVLISEQPDEAFEAFLAGNLCREDDILMQRSITLPKRPTNGDLLIFTARGAYQTYEQGNPQLQSTPTRYVLDRGDLRRDE